MPKSIADEYLLVYTNTPDLMESLSKDLQNLKINVDGNIVGITFSDNSKLFFDKEDVTPSLLDSINQQ